MLLITVNNKLIQRLEHTCIQKTDEWLLRGLFQREEISYTLLQSVFIHSHEYLMRTSLSAISARHKRKF